MAADDRRSSAPSPHRPPEIAEHQAPILPQHGPSYTAWHPLLAQVLVRVLTCPALEVHPFVKLGTLPLEADVILLRKSAEVDLPAQFPEFGFLLRFLRHYLLIEYKSPLDRLTVEDFDTARAYAMLCKRKYDLTLDEHVAVALLYSQAEPAFFGTCRDNGYAFVEIEAGIQACELYPLRVYAIDLVAFGAKNPEYPINLFSKRYRSFRLSESPWRTVLENTQRAIRGERQIMLNRLRGQEELERTLYEMEESNLASHPPERLLKHLQLEDRLLGLSEAERRRLRELLDQSESKSGSGR